MTTADDFLKALVHGDRRAADTLVDRELDRGIGLRALYLDVMQPAMREIGRLWEANEISVADEHLATAITQAAMGRAFQRVYEWRDQRRPTLIAACVDDERHQMGLRMLCDLLELEGWDTMYLGASVPAESLVQIVRQKQPQAVALSATIAPHLPQLRRAVQAIRASGVTPTPLIIAGGRAVSGQTGLLQQLGADLISSDAAEAVAVLQSHFATAR